MEIRSEIPLLSFSDIHTLLTHNVGLRLTDRLDEEMSKGGIGDAIPLSALGNVQQSIHFVTLCILFLQEEDELARAQYQRQFNDIFKAFANPSVDDVACVPNLMLTYARRVKLDHTNSTPIKDSGLPQNEVQSLRSLYEKSGGGVLPASLIFDQKSAYYEDFPCLRLHLSDDFNQLLQRRLILNHAYYSANSMYYVLLISERFTAGYDYAKYPLGKAGRTEFSPQDVIAYQQAVTDIATILTWLKQQCTEKNNFVKPLDSLDSNEYQKCQANPLTLTYLEQCSKYVRENKGHMVALLGVGIFTAVGLYWQQNQQTTDDVPAPGPL